MSCIIIVIYIIHIFYKTAIPGGQGQALSTRNPGPHINIHIIVLFFLYYSSLKRRFNKYFFVQSIREKRQLSSDTFQTLHVPVVVFKIFCQQK